MGGAMFLKFMKYTELWICSFHSECHIQVDHWPRVESWKRYDCRNIFNSLSYIPQYQSVGVEVNYYGN